MNMNMNMHNNITTAYRQMVQATYDEATATNHTLAEAAIENVTQLDEEKDKMSEDQHKQIARDLYKKYGYDAHSIGDLMQELVNLKGKFESEKKRKPITNKNKWYEPDRSAGRSD